MNVIQFAILGLGVGAVYTLLAQGITLIYRASGIINFAQGAVAMVGAFTFYQLSLALGLPFFVGLAAAIVFPAAVGGAFYWFVLKRMKKASPLARVFATLGLLTLLQGIATILFQDTNLVVPSALPTQVITMGALTVPLDRVILIGIAVVATVILYLLSTKTLWGLATSAVSENERSASTLGWSPDKIAVTSWIVGSAMAGGAAVLIIPLTGLNVTNMTLIIVPTLAVALLAGFRSFPVVLVCGVMIGIVQSVATGFVNVPGFAQSIAFIVIILVLVVRGKSLPIRSHVLERLPTIGSGIIRWRYIGPFVVIVAIVTLLLPPIWASAFGVTFTVAVMLLSVVVITGYAGQLSLAQYALGGVGALVAARLVAAAHVPFELAIIGGIVGALVVGLLFALPALRTRGMNLAIVTLGLGYTLQAMVFNNDIFSGGPQGTTVGPQTFFGISVDPLAHPGTYAVFCLGCFVLCAFIVTNVRRGRAGRRMIAVRTNERAAASLGVSVTGAKLFAFGLSSAIAGLAGVLLVFSSYFVVLSGFDPLTSINSVMLSVVGGIGYVVGPIFGATLAQGAVPGGLISAAWSNFNQWLTVIGGVVVILMLLQDANGLAPSNIRMVRNLLTKVRKRRSEKATTVAPFSLPAVESQRVAPKRLQVSNVTVRFGGVVALSDVSLHVEPGEVVGLIGPNGAGKTTLIDAITGFNRPASGTIELAEKRIDKLAPYRRAREGVTRSFQSLELFDDVSVLDNIRAASDRRDGWAYVADLIWPRKEPLSGSAVAAIHEFGLEPSLGRLPEDLPYAERRLVAIARAAATGPSVLLLDEPAAGLSEGSTAELAKLVRRLATTWGVGVLLIEHDMSFVMDVCDRIVVLEFGKKIAEGTPSEIMQDDRVIAAYLGEDAHAEASAPSEPLAEEVAR
jgi:ABC-type branched-subunit amino acid transport system ATPase component/branched-subunit amino acid ABC-type transport system permease component